MAHFKDAVEEWKAYAAIASSQYKRQLMARTHFMDWNRIPAEAEKEVAAAEREGDYPDVRFTNLKDGARFPVEIELQMEVDAADGDGIRELKLYLNGLFLKAHATEPQIWSGSSDELLKALKPGMYRLEAVAADKTGTFGRREIQIVVGDVSENSAATGSDELHQVILNEGERLMAGDAREFPRLECYLALEDDGKLALYRGAPGRSEGLIWKTRGKDAPHPHYAAFEKGQLVVYRGTPDHQEATLFQTRSVSGTGPHSFGISVSKKLVIVREVEGEERKPFG